MRVSRTVASDYSLHLHLLIQKQLNILNRTLVMNISIVFNGIYHLILIKVNFTIPAVLPRNNSGFQINFSVTYLGYKNIWTRKKIP